MTNRTSSVFADESENLLPTIVNDNEMIVVVLPLVKFATGFPFRFQLDLEDGRISLHLAIVDESA